MQAPLLNMLRLPNQRSLRPKLTRAFMVMILVFVFSVANASHFRYGLITATRLSETATTVTYRFNVNMAWRLGSAPASVAFSISGGNSGSFNVSLSNVTDPSGGWTNSTGSAVVTLNKSTALTRVSFSGCCKISTMVNNSDQSWDVYTVLNTNAPGSTPVSTMPAIINMPINAVAAIYTVPASDPDAGSTLVFGTPSFTGNLAGQVEPSGFSINSATGQITFNTIGKLVNQQYNALVTVTDNNNNQIMLDFIINMVGPSNPPVFDYTVTPTNGFVYNVIAGQNLSFPIKATDPDAGSTVSLSASGLPVYITTANFSPAMPATGNPSQTTFSWTPAVAQIGTTNVLNFIATDNVGVQSTTSVTIKVVAEPAPVFISPTPIQSSVRQIIPGVLHQDIIKAESSLGSNVSIAFATIPAGATLSPNVPTVGANPGQTTLSWTPVAADFGQKNLSFQTTISAVPTIFATRSYSIIVNTPPVFSSTPGTLTINAGQPFSYNIIVTDPDIPYGDVVDIIGSTLPSWLTLTPTGNGTALLQGTPTVLNGGNHEVELEAEDTYHHGNPSHVEQSFNIEVITCTSPVANCPSNIVTNVSPGVCGANVSFAATATGTPAPGISYSPASGSFFPVGTTTVTVTATNSCGTSTCTFTVTVNGGVDTDNDGTTDVCDTDDDNDGTLDASDCAPLDNTKWQSALLYIDVDNDNYTNGQQTVCYGATIPTGYKASSLGSDCNDNNNAVYPGATEVCNDVDDDCDGVVDDGFINTIINCPFTGTVTKNLQEGCTYSVTGNEFNATVTQNCGPLGYTLTGATMGTGTSLAGVQLNTGTTTVTWSATNANDQSFTCSFNVYVVPAPPAIVCPNNIIIAATNGQCGAVVNYTTPTLPTLCANNDNLLPTTLSFNYTGNLQTWTVPQGVTTIIVDAKGARGGVAMNGSIGGKPGYGGRVQTTLNVTPGQILNIYVGGNGVDANGSLVPPIAGGYNGGGNGSGFNPTGTGGGGGGSSDIRIGGTSLSNRIIIAAGGGGVGSDGNNTNGGGGGGLIGQSAANGNNPSTVEATGGTQISGGIAGSLAGYASAQNGQLALGGNGGGGIGGGGGAGYYGGGGGVWAGGAGGSSYTDPLLTINSIHTSDNNNGHGLITITYGSSSAGITQTAGLPSGANFLVGTTTNTFQITDAFGQTSNCSFTVTVNDEQAPTVVQPGDITVANSIGQCSASVNFSANATDNCSVTSLKYYLYYNTANQGEISFPKTFAVGSYLVTVVVKDAANNTTTRTFTITVDDTEKPTVSKGSIGSCYLSVAAAEAAAFEATTYSDNCSSFEELDVNVSTSGTCNAVITVTVTDASNNSRSVTYNTRIDNTAPVLSLTPASVTVNCQSVPSVPTVTANDNCDGSVNVTFTPGSTQGNDPAQSSYYNYTITRKWFATDGCGNTIEHVQTITVQDVTAPSLTCPANIVVSNETGLCSAQVTFNATSSDLCSTPTVKYYLYYGTGEQQEIGSPWTFAVGSYTVKVISTDPSGNSNNCTFTVIVNDTEKPNVTKGSIGSCYKTVALAQAAALAATTYSDNCTPNAQLNVNVATVGTCSAEITVTVTDAANNSRSVTYYTRIDNTSPVLSLTPANVTVNCQSVPPVPTVTASDNCDGNVNVTFTPTSTQGSNPAYSNYYNYTITRKWYATDGCGNTVEHVQTITVEDKTKPLITCPTDKLNVPFDFEQLYATIAIGTATATDNCAGNANIAIAGTRSDNVVITNTQYPIGQTTVAWSATDPSDNSDGCTQTITVRKRNTTVTYTGDMTDNKICVQYSDIINLQAKLTDNEGLVTPNNISGRTITFQLLSGITVLRSKSATTNANGVAVDTFKIEQAPGLYSVKTIFAGDSYFNVSNDLDNCEVKQEDADVEYNGSQYFTTSSSTTMAGSVTLAASLNDINDGIDKRGDIRKAKATFRDGGPAGNVLGSANLPVGLVNPNVLTNGLSATTQNYTLNTNEAGSGGKIFQVWVGASDHYKGADAGPTPVTLALPGQDFVTGGGHLVVTNSAGTYAGTVNSKMNFGFTMKWNKSGKSLQGNINIVFRKWQLYNGVWQWRVYQAKSNSINSMAVVEVGSNGQPVTATNPAMFRKAIINTKANLKDVTDPLNNIDLGGNHNLTLDAWDHITANGGVSDKISVTLMGATTNELLFSSSWSSNATQTQTITGGNINVRNGSSGSSTSINSITKSGQMEVTVKEGLFVVKAYPNPTEHEFTLIVNSNLSEKIEIQVYDAVGRKIQTLSAQANETIRFGEKLKTGVYIVKVIQGNRSESIKLIKQ